MNPTPEHEPKTITERFTSRSTERLDFGEMWVKQGVRAVLKGGALLEFERTVDAVKPLKTLSEITVDGLKTTNTSTI